MKRMVGGTKAEVFSTVCNKACLREMRSSWPRMSLLSSARPSRGIAVSIWRPRCRHACRAHVTQNPPSRAARPARAASARTLDVGPGGPGRAGDREKTPRAAAQVSRGTAPAEESFVPAALHNSLSSPPLSCPSPSTSSILPRLCLRASFSPPVPLSAPQS